MIQPVLVRSLRRDPRLLASLAAITLCIGFVAPAKGASDDKLSAKAHYETATRLYEVREYGDALKEYKAGYLTRPDPSFLFNIGQCYKKLGMPEEAREFFREYLKKAAADDPNRAQAEARIRELDSRQVANPSTPEVNGDASRSAPTPPEVVPAEKPSERAESEKSPAPPFSAAPAGSTGAVPAGVDLSASAPGQPDLIAQPFYKTWWFWTGVGAAVVAGTVTAILLSRNGDDSVNVAGTTLGTRTVLP